MNRRNFLGGFLAAIGVAAAAPKVMSTPRWGKIDLRSDAKPVWDANHGMKPPADCFLQSNGQQLFWYSYKDYATLPDSSKEIIMRMFEIAERRNGRT